MKFTFTYLLLLLTTTVFCDIFDDINERACENQLEDYEDCIEAYNAKKIMKIEETYKVLCSKKCVKYFNDQVKATPKCFSDDKVTESKKKKLDLIKENINNDCAVDGGGNYCPNTQALINSKYGEEIAKQTCKSKYCTDALIEIQTREEIAKQTCKSKFCTDALIQIYKENIDIVDYAKDMITFLNSTECREQNSANSLKFGSSLLLTFAALFFILLF